MPPTYHRIVVALHAENEKSSSGHSLKHKVGAPPTFSGIALRHRATITVRTVGNPISVLTRGMYVNPLYKGTGAQVQVPLVRMPTEDIADRRKLFELFTAIKTQALAYKDVKCSSLTDATIELWGNMVSNLACFPKF